MTRKQVEDPRLFRVHSQSWGGWGVDKGGKREQLKHWTIKAKTVAFQSPPQRCELQKLTQYIVEGMFGCCAGGWEAAKAPTEEICHMDVASRSSGRGVRRREAEVPVRGLTRCSRPFVQTLAGRRLPGGCPSCNTSGSSFPLAPGRAAGQAPGSLCLGSCYRA